jgi:adenylate cyclase
MRAAASSSVRCNESVEGGPGAACRQAFEAAKEGIDALACWNQSRPDGTPHLAAGFALHYGTVAYGNIGSGDRLDFTVIGRDVNLTNRIEQLCRELDQQLIMSGEFVARLQEPMFEIGHFALRGVPQMQLLFGLPPAPRSGIIVEPELEGGPVPTLTPVVARHV